MIPREPFAVVLEPIVKLSEGWISFSVDKKTEADETSGMLLRVSSTFYVNILEI